MFMSVVLPAPFSPSRPSTWPRSAEIEILSFARTPGKRFVMSRSSSRIGGLDWYEQTAPGPRSGPGAVDGLRFGSSTTLAAAPEEGADLDAAVGDRRPQRLDLGLELGRDLAVEVVERREEHAVVGERARVVLAAEVATGLLR